MQGQMFAQVSGRQDRTHNTSDQSSGKSEKITITNDKSRLSADEIEKMVADAERYKDEDDKQKERISAKNSLEAYCFNMKSTVEDGQMKDKIPENDRNTILDACTDAINWLDRNQTAELDEFKDKQKEVEAVCNPIITKLYQGQGGAAPGGPSQPNMNMGGNSGPTVEEVD